MEEIERTYLLKELPKDLDKFPFKEMLDIYIPTTEEHPRLRIRKSGNKTEITKKMPIDSNDLSRHFENTIPLEAGEYVELSLLPGKRVRKLRYLYEENGYKFEIDVFQDELKGLVEADIEFENTDQRDAFRPPEWCLVEVTQEDFLAGGMLCGKKYSDIEPILDKYVYKKIL